MPTASCSTATSPAKRAANSPQILRRRCCFTGSRCAGRFASAATCRPVTTAEADAYFATRPKQAQIGAWASKQSQPLESRFAFEQAIAKVAAKYIIGDVPRPPGWSGWRIAPAAVRILARSPVPPARPHRIPPRRAGSALVQDAALSLSESLKHTHAEPEQ